MGTVEPFFTAAFGKSLAKTFIISTATSVGMMAGLYIAGLVAAKVNDRRQKTCQPATSE